MSTPFEITTRTQRTGRGKSTGTILASIAPVGGSSTLTATGTKISTAKQALIDKLGTMAHHAYSRSYIFCGDGKTILVVAFLTEGWAYDIVDPERATPCSCHLGTDHDWTYAMQAAKSHAEQSYGGIRHIIP